MGLALGLSVAYSRVYLGYHSLKQVLVGLGVGGCAGCAWFFIYLSILEPFGKVFTRTWIAQKLLIRDASSIGNIVKFEHNIYSLHESKIQVTGHAGISLTLGRQRLLAFFQWYIFGLRYT